jgi:hypothetical protein
MTHPRPPWSPSAGDPVRLKDSRLVGTVIQTKGVHAARFRVNVPPPAAGSDAAALKRARAAARRASRWYGLDELEPPS